MKGLARVFTLETLVYVLISVALAVPILRYATAFQQVESPLRLWGNTTVDISPLTGLAFGATYEAAVFLGLREGMAARRRKLKSWWWPLASAGAQVVLGLWIMGPVLFSNLRGGLLSATLENAGAAWAWAETVAGATLLTFATLAITLAVHAPAHAAQGASAGTHPAPVATQARRKGATYPRLCGCGFSAADRFKWANHQRKCPLRVAAPMAGGEEHGGTAN